MHDDSFLGYALTGHLFTTIANDDDECVVVLWQKEEVVDEVYDPPTSTDPSFALLDQDPSDLDELGNISADFSQRKSDTLSIPEVSFTFVFYISAISVKLMLSL